MDYLALLDLGLSFFNTYLAKLGHKLPAEVVAAIQAAIDAITEHQTDIISKANLEKERE